MEIIEFSNNMTPINIAHGLVVIDLNDADVDDISPVLHFVGLALEPGVIDMTQALDEFIEANPEYDDSEYDLSVQIADDEIIEYYRSGYLTWLAERN